MSAVLGTMNAVKPLGLTAMAVLVTPEKGRPPSRWTVLTAGAAVASAVPWLLIGREHLPAMSRQAGGGRPEWNYNLSLHRVLFALGLPIPASLMLLLVTGIYPFGPLNVEGMNSGSSWALRSKLRKS